MWRTRASETESITFRQDIANETTVLAKQYRKVIVQYMMTDKSGTSGRVEAERNINR